MEHRSTFIEGKYEILGKISEGGMGAIYKVRHRLLDEIRVVKVMKPQVLADKELRKRFLEEAKTATRLKHPNICTIHDFSLDEDGTAYLVMEFIDGVTLAQLTKSETPVSVGMAVEIARQALLALGYLHRRNVVHRDIAPDNLMLTSDEEGGPLVKLIDLGIAKDLDRPSDMTSTGVFLGKLKYASPEQYGALPPGEKIDGRSDLYCLGLVLYELMTGARPFVGETPAEMIRTHLFQPPKPFSETDPDGRVPPAMRAAILKSLEKKREDRFATAEEFLREVERIKADVPGTIDVDSTVQFVSNARATQQVTGAGITSSAQNRLDQRFVASSTPHPTRPPQTDAESETRAFATPLPPTPPLTPPREPARAAPLPSAPSAPSASSASSASSGSASAPSAPSAPPAASANRATTSLPTRRPGRASRIALAAALIGAAAVAVLVMRSAGRSPAAAAARSAEPAARNAGLVTPPEAVSPTSGEANRGVLPPVVTDAPVVSATSVPSEVVAARIPSPPAEIRVRPTPRLRTAGAEDRIARNAVPTRRAGAFPLPPPTSAARIIATAPSATVPPAPAPTAPPPVQVAVVRPTTLSAEPVVGSPGEVRGAAADQEKIREVLRAYERAHNTLDVELYARVFPALVSRQRQNLDRAWRGLRSQHLELEVRQIDVRGNQATVRAFQRLEAVPQAGEGQRDSREVTLKLEKRGDGWVIAGRT